MIDYDTVLFDQSRVCESKDFMSVSSRLKISDKVGQLQKLLMHLFRYVVLVAVELYQQHIVFCINYIH
jgi:hypothetical protein